MRRPASGQRRRMKPSDLKKPGRLVRFFETAELLVSHRRRIDGLWVICADRTSPAWSAVEEALRLIKQHDRVRYDRLCRDLACVWVRVIPGSLGRYNRPRNACEVDERFVLAQASRPELVAALIVHEATHARLTRCGIGYEEALRARIESVCARRERAFAAKLPNGEQVQAQAEWRLLRPADTWTNANWMARYEKDLPSALRHIGLPEWLIRFIIKMAPMVRRLVRLVGRLRRFR